ncbi:MAG: glycoside hydrolase family 127 protein [Lentisphaerae bacterium]|nr:glycoside hydrolase family 127 protein [Lentisphaerota bacterium]
MATRKPHPLSAVSFTQVSLHDAFWAPRQRVNRKITLPIEYQQCRKTGRIDAFKLEWKPGLPNEPHIFWDSDVGKWIEAAAYSLMTHPDKKLEARIDGVAALMARAQQPDGYLNAHFTVVEPEKRWANLSEWHELYCAGHLMEGAVAYYEATGKRAMLDVMCRYADLICKVFGRGPGQKRGYCGHEEVELALVKLYRATGAKRYLSQAKYFIDERGQAPNYFKLEAEALQKKGWKKLGWVGSDYSYCQAHRPVREQGQVVGHAVRAMYLYCGMADVATETGDATLRPALKRLWNHLTHRRLYVTGGIGSTRHNEGFTFDYDLPNETAYCETCASVGLVFWAHRMLQLTGDGEVADILERTLYNGALSGVSLDGKRFFYANPLAVYPAACTGAQAHVAAERQEWFGCACCPPNIARLIASVGQYFYSQSEKAAWIHLYAQGDAALRVAGQTVRLRTDTRYPWDGEIRMRLAMPNPARFTLALRIPAWCPEASLAVNHTPWRVQSARGYTKISRRWESGDVVNLRLSMPVLQVEAHPKVRGNCGRVALQRGPLVYCVEQVDNGRELRDLTLPAAARFRPAFVKSLLGGVTVLRGRAFRRHPREWRGGRLYRMAPTRRQAVPITAVPYCVWGNRAPGQEMLVWMNKEPDQGARSDIRACKANERKGRE